MFEDESYRLSLLKHILLEKRQGNMVYDQYMSQNREYMPGTELHMREAHFLMAVEPGKGRTMSELAQQLNVTQGAVSQTASRLEKKGLLIRLHDRHDQRRIVARLTPAGEEFYFGHQRYDETQYHRFLERLNEFSDDQLKLFARYEQVMAEIFQTGLDENKA